MARVASVGAPAVVATSVGRGPVTALVGVTGLLVGSFLNVVIYRVPRGLSVVEPRSFCPHCTTPVRTVDNIPVVSWVVLRGRCRRCRGPISVRYPLIELATGIVFAAVGWGLGPHWGVGGACVLAATLIALVAIERDGLAPPISVAATGTVIATAALVAAGVADRRWAHVVGVTIGASLATVVVAVARRQRNRSDDATSWTAAAPVVLPVGAALGWLGPASVGEGLATAAVVVLVTWAVRQLRSSAAPGRDPGMFGVALASGVVLATVIAVAVGAGAGR
jgi:leader peptidase (prepilin peptidase)/N-methyltransferase